MQHGVNPRGGGIVFVLLDEFMRGVPFAGQSQFNRLEQSSFIALMAFVLPPNRRRQQMDLRLRQHGSLTQLEAAMKITDVLRAEHSVFHNLFDHIEAVVPKLKTLAR